MAILLVHLTLPQANDAQMEPTTMISHVVGKRMFAKICSL